ncbi:MAG: hypothetical protein MUO62_17285, partial [Anaerolineales bacterium]|nr:hypothetical protein [Anaerolineales bacterium]
QAFKAAGKPFPTEARTTGLIYRPVLLAQANVRFLKLNYNLNHEVQPSALVVEIDQIGGVRWEEWQTEPIERNALDRRSLGEARFASLEAPFSDPKSLRALEVAFKDWVYYEQKANVLTNETLKVYAGPQIPAAEFKQMCRKAAMDEQDKAIQKAASTFDRKIDTLKDRLLREERELKEDETELSQRKMEELGTHAENLLSMFSGRRRKLTTSLSKRRMTSQAKADVEESLDAIEEYKREVASLEKERAENIETIKQKWEEVAEDTSEIQVTPYKKDIMVNLFGVAWFPYHLVESEGRTLELPAYGKV